MNTPDFHEEDHYNATARFFHWAVAFLVVIMLGIGLTMGSVDFGIPRSAVYDLHKSLGLLVLLLAIVRLIWRFASVPPEALSTHAPWERTLAKVAHAFLYFSLFAMPLSGWLMSDAAGRPPTFFGMQVPRLLEHNDSLRGFFGTAHELIAWGLIFVIGLHVAGALKHHIIDKDGTLRRMAGDRLGWFKTLVLFLLLDIAIMSGAFLFLKSAAPMQTPTSETSISEQIEAAPDTAHPWQIIKEESAIRFQSSAFGTQFTGQFEQFDGVILFDPENLGDARIDIIINMDRITSGDSERDAMIQNKDWFATEDFPQARFTAHTLEALGEDRYIAVGDLTIRDVTMPVSLPFSLTITPLDQQLVAHMQGETSIGRLNFGVGQGEWQKTEVVPDTVSVTIEIKATQPR